MAMLRMVVVLDRKHDPGAAADEGHFSGMLYADSPEFCIIDWVTIVLVD